MPGEARAGSAGRFMAERRLVRKKSRPRRRDFAARCSPPNPSHSVTEAPMAWRGVNGAETA